MYYRTTKLDWRFNGKSHFDFRLEFPLHAYINGISNAIPRFRDYQQMREWLWETFGPGCERDLYSRICDLSDPAANPPVWAWHYDNTDNEPFIYIADSVTLAHVQLKWS